MEKHKLYLDKLNEFYSKNSFLYKDELMQNTLLRVMGKDVISSNTTNVQSILSYQMTTNGFSLHSAIAFFILMQ